MSFENFEKWMELATDLSEKSIKNYLGGISKIDKDLLEISDSPESLEAISSINELENLKIKYFSDREYKELDTRGNGMYSASFNKFIQYKSSSDFRKNSKEGIVYLIANPAMPGLVKLGKTIDLKERLKQLFNTSVPFPFRCIYAKKVKDYSEVERKLHKGLNNCRANMNREFFSIAEDEVINFLELIPGEDVTPKEDNFEDKVDQLAFEKATKIAQRFNFQMVDIPIGATLLFNRNKDIKCIVKSNTRVDFEGENHSLSSAALLATNRMGFNWKAVSGPTSWTYEDETLDERRKRFESGNYLI
tara:strand:- start:31 stop:942 length:912 start_codon:yes stop_codon:yes gene_type:complete